MNRKDHLNRVCICCWWLKLWWLWLGGWLVAPLIKYDEIDDEAAAIADWIGVISDSDEDDDDDDDDDEVDDSDEVGDGDRDVVVVAVIDDLRVCWIGGDVTCFFIRQGDVEFAIVVDVDDDVSSPEPPPPVVLSRFTGVTRDEEDDALDDSLGEIKFFSVLE